MNSVKNFSCSNPQGNILYSYRKFCGVKVSQFYHELRPVHKTFLSSTIDYIHENFIPRNILAIC